MNALGKHSLSALGLAVLAACSGATAVNDGGIPPAACTFRNPIGAGADPWVVRSGGNYYLVESRDNAIHVYKSASLTGIKDGERREVWRAPAEGWNETNIWAPELHRFNGRWYIYYAGGTRHPNGEGAPFTSQRAGVLESTGDDPQGSYVDKGMLDTGGDPQSSADNVWAIDLTVGTINGQLYAIWSGWEANNTATDRVPQHLYIARMSDPLTISTARARLSSPTASWEDTNELDLQEGPTFLERAGALFIVYSTGESWLPTYKLGQLRLTNPADPLDPGSYVKTGPVFTGTNDIYGVGHASFTKSPDGTEDWIVYHSKVDPTPGWNRVIRMQKFTWNTDGSPNFGIPKPTNEPTSMPSGQCS